MTSAEKWNLIVAGYKCRYSQPEAIVQAEWEMYCTELFGYKKILHEIDAQRHLKIGSGGTTIIPDIILCKNGNDIFDIELKQYSLLFNDSFETQLISYLNMTHLSVGMIVCSKIYLYYYEYKTISVNKIEIPFETDHPDGIALMEMLTKDTFSAVKIKEYIFEKKLHEKNIEAIRKCFTSDWIKETVRTKLLEKYPEQDVESALNGYSFKAMSSVKVPSPFPPSFPVPIPSTPRPSDPKLDISPIVHQWCREKAQQGGLNFLEHKSNKHYARFTTDDLDELLPYQNGVKGAWNTGHFYAYEVVDYKGQFKMWIAFCNKNAPDFIRQSFARIMQVTGKMPKKEKWQWWVIFTTPYFSYNEKTTREEITNALEQQFAQIRANVRKMLEII